MVWIKKVRNKGEKESKFNISDKWNIVHEEGREVIQQWRNKRLRIGGARKSYHEFLVYTFTLDTLRSFGQNINFMVVIQMVMAIIAIYIFQTFKISFYIPVTVFVSPIVFPLAFSINTDFQRREKVLDDLAVFKSCGMVWYFCMREWKQAAELDSHWMTAVHGKLKSLLFHLREYLLTYKLERRKIILRAMYEDFSDANQLIEKVRASKLPANTAIVSRSIHLLNMMCLSFERLRVIREYRSPRSIRSFNKVFIMVLPIILAPYFIDLSIKSHNKWEPYYIAVLVAFVFSSLQGVQDKLDDPFDGMSEDDINLDTIDEWTFSSLEHTMKRTFDIGRFKVTVDVKDIPKEVRQPIFKRETDLCDNSKCSTRRRSSTCCPRVETSLNNERADYQKLALMLEGVKGNTRITRRSLHKKSSEIIEDMSSQDDYLETIFEPATIINDDTTKGHEVDGNCNHYNHDTSLDLSTCDIEKNISDSYNKNSQHHHPFDDVTSSIGNTFNGELFFVNPSATGKSSENISHVDEGKRRSNTMGSSVFQEKVKRISDGFENIEKSRDNMVLNNTRVSPDGTSAVEQCENLNNRSVSFVCGGTNGDIKYHVISVNDEQSPCEHTHSDLHDHELEVITNNKVLDLLEKYKG